MKQRIIAGNWKMNTRRSEAMLLIESIRHGVDARHIPSSIDVVICPPFLWLVNAIESCIGYPAIHHSSQSTVRCGAQDCHHEASGAFTGDVSAQMLADIGCADVIVGHSERRLYHGETNALIARKIHAAIAAGLRPIVCVGESAHDREHGATRAVITQQLDELVTGAGSAAMNSCVIAYEPLWAIGTGVAASPEQAQDVHALIRETLTAIGAATTPLLYGGSVTAQNAPSLFACRDIDGALIGGASLSAESFLTIIDAAVTAWAE
jgi:triosephosphate isomerase